MASVLDNVKLGFSGLEDLAGIGNGHEVADTLAQQKTAELVDAGAVAPEQAAQVQADIQAGVAADEKAHPEKLAKAAEKTEARVSSGLGKLKWVLIPAALLAGLALVAYVLTVVRSFIPRKAG